MRNQTVVMICGLAFLIYGAFGANDEHRAPCPPFAVVQDALAEIVRSAQSRAPTQQYSHGEPTNDEQYMLEMINRARANPTQEGARLATTTDSDVKAAYSAFSIDLAQVQTEFAAITAQPPLAFNSMLISSARRHTTDMYNNNFQSHTGSDGSTLSVRVNDAGYTSWNALAENIYAYSKNIWYGHCGFNVDWGNAAPYGHRQNIMSSGGTVTTEIGIGISYKANYVSGSGPYVITQDFGKKNNTAFLCGVVYNDTNGNGFYDPGEGVSGVSITPDIGAYYAVSSTSGGYTIPITGLSGTMNIAFSGNGVANWSNSIALTGKNIKMDYVIGSNSNPTYNSNTLTDTDSDGFPDELETWLGTSTTIANTLPKQTLSLVTPAKLSLKLNFAKADSDNINLSWTQSFASGFQITGQQIAIDIGGFLGLYTFDDKGKAVGDNITVKISGRIKNGAFVSDKSVKVKIKLSRGNAASFFTDEGLTNNTARKENRSIPVVIIFLGATQNTIIQGAFPVVWTARVNKNGNAKGGL